MIFLVLVLSYLIGSISGSFILGKLFLHKDVRNYGSGNAGTTNAMRVFGKKIGSLTFIIDMLKGILVVLLLKKFFPEYLFLGVLFCILGHDFPFYMKFKGGKGVATSLGSFIFINIKLTFIPGMIMLITLLSTKIMSLSSILFLSALLVSYIGFGSYSIYEKIIIAIVCLLGIVRHKSNIKRLIEGKELKLGGKNEK
ncbi:glycerol-3-phosphate acyltransferase PlsY [Peptoniphilus koenoeneniae]|uniref:Glycerol-3-phosphate acyltransferase n=1 Tax=Peptoniphilus koenoeneniae TaxID=507751 RepID=A0ABU0AS67_9FIRM|nr:MULTISPECIES: glycerol-3-phosphate 1-O-acyltransferase PlsY [Peptoniphilus]ERT56677.1 acyl-phosphate glycerol 3-phosphate acyltransferase [Peptoniphilus sp. BV3C26]MDQ0274104.1 glycerol-3-phosphate acyltransferase PlsY [Peptoniphilus koenoeneniae]